MTVTQIVVVIVGLILGYCLVNYMLSSGRGDDGGVSGSSPNSKNDGSSDRSHANDQEDHSCDSSTGRDDPSSPATGTTLTWYQTLGVSESASMTEINRAYRVQISQYHPDKVTKLGEDIRRLAEVRSKEINGAYDIAVRLRRK